MRSIKSIIEELAESAWVNHGIADFTLPVEIKRQLVADYLCHDIADGGNNESTGIKKDLKYKYMYCRKDKAQNGNIKFQFAGCDIKTIEALRSNDYICFVYFADMVNIDRVVIIKADTVADEIKRIYGSRSGKAVIAISDKWVCDNE